MKKEQIHEDMLGGLVLGGRSVDEQIDYVRKYGNHAASQELRNEVLAALDIPKPKETAENLVIFGCYFPFWSPQSLQDFIDILEHLEVDYTYLEKELCCCAPMVVAAEEKEKEKVMTVVNELMLIHRNHARRQGATSIAYFCQTCAYLAKYCFPDNTIRQLYYPDLIMEKLGDRKLKVSPTVVGYYEGCQVRRRAMAPGVELDWPGYHKLLDSIEGLELVDLPHEICCRPSAEPIVEAARKANLDTILCSCNGCFSRVRTTAQERVRVKNLPEILLRALRGE
jgi:Fe-S oxidoreductase